MPADPVIPVGRFAPSPTGALHFGSLLTALASWLDARAGGGRWLVRIEDIDTPRVVPGAADDILRTLEACGLYWDGTPVWQSQRLELYAQVLEQLQQAGLLYLCRCSRSRLAATARRGPCGLIYPGYCRDAGLPLDQAGALRLRTDAGEVHFTDRVQGKFKQSLHAEVGDFVLRRADGLYAYQLVVVVDDALQQVTDIVRGADLLDSTPRQIYLQRLLGYPAPSYAHVPLAVDAKGDKLSKLTHARAIDCTRAHLALWDALEFLGQQPPDPLRGADVSSVLDWARQHWAMSQVPSVLHRQWPTPVDTAAGAIATPSS
ncbi:tRNA glutamyl-Q(34) synthetase GluQRS [Plasticicumulans acidivorans]|uniref:Glutamyl-Q tRNA(Asp) synthetase n=1 Tax=Plasticicumulans acidivorans TaxID=886464 RepID=A0A317N0C3_9GAMM|nr:tRNA glutamyl-Q(34) synthetase GluQRS [Plasticicumulans acidivorans]PWV65935.1 glutamyl-Q tRNA(Asp) synthetase [Plasticicumulans acidivorans]